MSSVLLRIKNVYKKYGQKTALNGVSLDINQGEIFGLLGVNGAGKTTLSSIIATLHPPTAGSIEFQGRSIYEDISAYRLQLGFCPQRPNLHAELTLLQNLQFAGSYYGMTEQQIERRIAILADQLSLHEYLPQKASVLSGGYKQRFMIARSVIHQPKIVLLDEPTVGLDPHIRRQLWAIIRALKNEGVTIILTTHYLDEAETLSDRVCILDKGSIKLLDTPANLMANYQQKNLEEVFVQLTEETR